ncbi:MAG: hypothetical protein L3J31_05650 [Bacteroidales bacterium]|nr:hypothetical protein [Bacteroidales bacterium]
MLFKRKVNPAGGLAPDGLKLLRFFNPLFGICNSESKGSFFFNLPGRQAQANIDLAG